MSEVRQYMGYVALVLCTQLVAIQQCRSSCLTFSNAQVDMSKWVMSPQHLQSTDY
jgi:hypothetical protein